jgi:hypothetical protein
MQGLWKDRVVVGWSGVSVTVPAPSVQRGAVAVKGKEVLQLPTSVRDK